MATKSTEIELANIIPPKRPKIKADLITLGFGCDLEFQPTVNSFATSNIISTTRYNLWTFLPKSLFEQFRRIANVYFLVQAILMVLGEQFPDDVFQTPYGSYTVTSSLAVVVGFTMVKEAVEDRKRYRKDQETNARKTSILDASGNFEQREWKDVKVGNIVKVLDREEVPADLILLTSVNNDGGCYVETSNIDGETNLKIREAETTLADLTRTNERPDPFKLGELRGELRCEAPNKNIHSFVGRVDIDSEESEKPIAVGSKQFLLRGSQLRNTPWIWGIVVYTGPQTKVMKNSRDAPSKLSILEQTMNQCIMLVLATQMVVCLAGAVAACAWSENNALFYNTWLMSTTETVVASPWEKYHSQFFTFVVLFNNFLPISLYVTVETVLIFQASFIEDDIEMYDSESDTPASVRTSNLNSDFGQVDFIFSDKTGTLTQNIMKLQQISVNGVVYGGKDAVRSAAAAVPDYTAFNDARTHDILVSNYAQMKISKQESKESKESKEGNDTNDTNDNTDNTDNNAHNEKEKTLSDALALDQFFTCMTVCHTVVVEKQKGGQLTYQAESPDEGALVYSGVPIGYELVDRTASTITVSIAGIVGSVEEEAVPDVGHPYFEGNLLRRYEILAINGFDATRKRMSIVVRDPTGRVVLYCKGADNKMLECLNKDCITAEEIDQMNDHLDTFARVGLRTLVMGQRYLTEKEYEDWSNQYDRARTSVENREALLMECAMSIESELELIGASAIEDKLQDGVPSAIKRLRASGVSVWVLTGDKAETAKNIGKSCQLLTPNMQIIEVDKDNDEELDILLTGWLVALGNLAVRLFFLIQYSVLVGGFFFNSFFLFSPNFFSKFFPGQGKFNDTNVEAREKNYRFH